MFRAIVPALRRTRVNTVWRLFANDGKKKKRPSSYEMNMPEGEEFGNSKEWRPDELDEIFCDQAFEEDDVACHKANKAIPGEKRVFMGDILSGGQPIDTSKWRIQVPSLTLKLIKYNPVTKTYDIVDAKSDQYFFESRAVILGFVGCFFPECTQKFLYDWARSSKAFKQQFGFTELIACSVNDPFVMKRFAEKLGFEGRINFVADWNGEWTQFLDTAIPEEAECSHIGFRGGRYSGVLMENEVKVVNQSLGNELLYFHATTPDYLWEHCARPELKQRIFL